MSAIPGFFSSGLNGRFAVFSLALWLAIAHKTITNAIIIIREMIITAIIVPALDLYSQVVDSWRLRLLELQLFISVHVLV